MGASHGGTSHNKSSNALKTIEEIRKGNIRDLYVLTGENDFLKERVVFWLREQTKAEVVRVDAENMDVLRSLTSYSLFSPMRVIVVELPAKKVIRDAMISAVSSGNLSGVVVVMGDAKIPGAEVVECKPLAKKQAVSWIVAEFRLHGVRCDLEVAEQLLDLCDGDLWSAYTEIEKLSLVTKKVTMEHLQTFVVGSMVKGNYFALMDALQAADEKRAQLEMGSLLEQGEAFQQIFVFLYRIFSLAWKSKEFNMDNKAALAQAAGRSPFFVMRCMEIGKWYSLETLRDIISAFLHLDFMIKTGEIDEQGAAGKLMQIMFPKKREAIR